jgi:ribonuclease HI
MHKVLNTQHSIPKTPQRHKNSPKHPTTIKHTRFRRSPLQSRNHTPSLSITTKVHPKTTTKKQPQSFHRITHHSTPPQTHPTRNFSSFGKQNEWIYDPQDPNKFDSKAANWQCSSYTRKDGEIIAPGKTLNLRRELRLGDKNQAKYYDPTYNHHLNSLNEVIQRARANGNILCFTDGSSLTNPGPSGCGISIEYPLHNTPFDLFQRQFPFLLQSEQHFAQSAAPNGQYILAKRHYKAAGNEITDSTQLPAPLPNALRFNIAATYGGATNNYGELKAIETALIYLENLHLSNQISLQNKKIFLISDSDWALKMVTGQFRPKEQYVNLVTAMRSKLAVVERRYSVKVEFLWCKGHSNIEGNEFADQLGSAAAELSKQNMLGTQIDPIIEQNVSNVHGLYYITRYNLNSITSIRKVINPKQYNELIDDKLLQRDEKNGEEYYRLTGITSSDQPPSKCNPSQFATLLTLYPDIVQTVSTEPYPIAPLLPVDVVNQLTHQQRLDQNVKSTLGSKADKIHTRSDLLKDSFKTSPPSNKTSKTLPPQPCINLSNIDNQEIHGLITQTGNRPSSVYANQIFSRLINPSKAFLTKALLLRDELIAQTISDHDVIDNTPLGKENQQSDPTDKTQTLPGVPELTLEEEREVVKTRQAEVVANEMAGLGELIAARNRAENRENNTNQENSENVPTIEPKHSNLPPQTQTTPHETPNPSEPTPPNKLFMSERAITIQSQITQVETLLSKLKVEFDKEIALHNSSAVTSSEPTPDVKKLDKKPKAGGSRKIKTSSS